MRPHRRSGFTLVEMVGALGILAIAGAGLMALLSAASRNARGREAAETAERLLRNETERLRASDPRVPLAVQALRLDAGGSASASGPFLLTLERRAICTGIPVIPDPGLVEVSRDGRCPFERRIPALVLEIAFETPSGPMRLSRRVVRPAWEPSHRGAAGPARP